MPDTFRKEYTPLNDAQKAQMADVKNKAEEIESILNAVAPTGERSERARCVAIARTQLEIAIMCAVKAITTPPEEKQ